jgi:hypothetical protein
MTTPDNRTIPLPEGELFPEEVPVATETIVPSSFPAPTDLWSSLLAMIPDGKKQIVKKRLDRIDAKSNLEAIRAPKPVWRETEVILIIHEATCLCCEARFQWPNQWLLIKKEHSIQGTHYVQAEPSSRLDPEIEYAHLPMRTEYQLCEVRTCHHCFNIAHQLRRSALNRPNQAPTAEELEAEITAAFDNLWAHATTGTTEVPIVQDIPSPDHFLTRFTQTN